MLRDHFHPLLVAACMTIIASGANAACVAEEKEGIVAMKECPADVTQFIDHAALCYHFAGEMTGRDDERGREVNAAIEEYKCDDEQDACNRNILLKRYEDKKEIREAFSNALHLLYGEDYGNFVEKMPSKETRCQKY